MKGAVTLGALAVVPLASADRAEAILPEEMGAGPSAAPAAPPAADTQGQPPRRRKAPPPRQVPPPDDGAGQPSDPAPAPRDRVEPRPVRPDIPRAPGVVDGQPVAQQHQPRRVRRQAPRRQEPPRRRGRTPDPPAAPANPIDPPTPPIGRTVRPDIPLPGPPPGSGSAVEEPAEPAEGELTTAKGLADPDVSDVIQSVGKRMGDDDGDDGGTWTLPELAADAGSGVADGLQVTGRRAREYLDQGPVCVQVSYYDRFGGGAGVCVDTAEREVLLSDEAGVGTGGGVSVERPDELPEHGYCGLGGAVTSGGGGGYFLVGMDTSGDAFGDYSVFPGAGFRRGRIWSGGFGRETKTGRRVGRPGPWGWTQNDGGRHRGRPAARGQAGRYLAATAQGKLYVTCGATLHW